MAVRERAWTLVVPHHPSGARQARQRLAMELHGLVAPTLLGDVVAVVAELLGNAVRHAEPLPGGVIRLVFRVGSTAVDARSNADGSLDVAIDAGSSDAVYVLLRVTDGGSEAPPAAREATPDSVDGRGLAIVSALARRWGVEPDGEGQCVWAELGTPLA